MKNLVPLAILLVLGAVNVILIHVPGAPRAVGYIPDAFLSVLMVFGFLQIVAKKTWARIPLRYWVVFLSFIYVCIAGAILNEVTGDTIFAGSRTYLRYVPAFLLPFALQFSDRDLKIQTWLFGGFVLLQLPFTLFQRFVTFTDLRTGDYIIGTLTSTSSTAMFVAIAMIGLIILAWDKRITIKTAVLMAPLVFAPAALADVRAAPFFLIAGIGGLLLAKWKQLNIVQLLPVAVAGAIVVVGFIAVYDSLYEEEDDISYIEFLTNPAIVLDSYNLKGVRALPYKIPKKKTGQTMTKKAPKVTREVAELGRLDTLFLPFDAMYPHAMTYLLFGLGIGNVDTDFGSGGDYKEIETFYAATYTTVSTLIWELGVFGALFFIAYLILVGRDSYALSQQREGIEKTLGAFTLACVFILLLGMIYANMFHIPEIPLLLAYLGGLVLRRRVSVAAVEKPKEQYLVGLRTPAPETPASTRSI